MDELCYWCEHPEDHHNLWGCMSTEDCQCLGYQSQEEGEGNQHESKRDDEDDTPTEAGYDRDF